jgi:hypothetical protein
MLWNCLLPDKTSIGEGKQKARLERRTGAGECILVFRIDNAEFRRQFGLSQSPLCDALFFLGQQQDHPTLLPVELKGSDIAKAVQQLESAVNLLLSKLPKKQTRYVPVIVTSSRVPHQAKKLFKDFSRKFGFEVRVSRDGNLRDFLQ